MPIEQSMQQLGQTSVWAIAFHWKADNAGAVAITPAKLPAIAQGSYLVSVETEPGAVVPTDGYSIELINDNGNDLLGGQAAGLVSATSQIFGPVSGAPPINGTFNLKITGNLVALAQGKVTVYIQPTIPPPTTFLTPSSNWISNVTHKPFIDVRSYGAVGDGVTDDSTAIAAAIAAAGSGTGAFGVLGHGGGVVYLPPGNYLATIVVPSNVSLIGSGWLSTNIYAKADGATVISTARGSCGITIANLNVYLNFKQGCTAFDIVSTANGVFKNLRVTGGGDLGAGAITGTSMKIRSGGLLISDLVIKCVFENLHIETGPVTGIQIGHNDDATCKPVTLCEFKNIRINCSGPALIDIIGNADSNYMERIYLGQPAGGYGIVFNSGNPTVDNNVSGWTIMGVAGGDAGTAAPLLFNYCSYINVYDLESLATVPYVVAHSPDSVFVDIPVGVVVGGLHRRTHKYFGGIRIGSVNDGSFIAYPRKEITLANGANHDVDIAESQYVRLNGPTGAFSITGFTGGSLANDGRPLRLFNGASYAMTIKNMDAGSSAANRILTNTGADVTLRAGTSVATFFYSGADSLWILESTN